MYIVQPAEITIPSKAHYSLTDILFYANTRVIIENNLKTNKVAHQIFSTHKLKANEYAGLDFWTKCTKYLVSVYNSINGSLEPTLKEAYKKMIHISQRIAALLTIQV